MKDKLPGVGSLKVNRGSIWPPIIGGAAGALIGLSILSFDSYVFVRINTVMIGVALGGLYGWVSSKEIKIGTTIIGAIIGGLCGIYPISLWALLFGGLSVALYVLLIKKKFALLWVCTTAYAICTLMVSDIYRPRSYSMNWGIGLFGSLVPFLNIWIALGNGIIIFEGLVEDGISAINILNAPYFAVPSLIFVGYFMGCKVSEAKGQKKLAKGGFEVAKEKIAIPEILNEKKIKKDLVFYRGKGEKLLNSYLSHLVERFKTGQEIKTLKTWTEQLNIKTEFIQAATEAGRAQSEFDRVDTESEMKEEKLKTARLEHQYEQKELQQKLKNLELEEEHKRLELQRKIHDLKGPSKPKETELEKIKRQESERAMRIMERIKGITEKAAFLSDWKKRMRSEHPEEAEEIIDEVDRMMVEESLKEE